MSSPSPTKRKVDALHSAGPTRQIKSQRLSNMLSSDFARSIDLSYDRHSEEAPPPHTQNVHTISDTPTEPSVLLALRRFRLLVRNDKGRLGPAISTISTHRSIGCESSCASPHSTAADDAACNLDDSSSSDAGSISEPPNGEHRIPSDGSMAGTMATDGMSRLATFHRIMGSSSSASSPAESIAPSLGGRLPFQCSTVSRFQSLE